MIHWYMYVHHVILLPVLIQSQNLTVSHWLNTIHLIHPYMTKLYNIRLAIHLGE